MSELSRLDNFKLLVVGDIPIVFENLKDILLVNPNSPKELAEAFNILANNSDLRKCLGTNAKKKAKEFDWNSIARKLVQVYNKFAN